MGIDEKEGPHTFTRRIAPIIKGLMREHGVTQTRLAAILDRSQAYVSERASGKEAWNTDELEVLARQFGLSNGFELLRVVDHRLNV